MTTFFTTIELAQSDLPAALLAAGPGYQVRSLEMEPWQPGRVVQEFWAEFPDVDSSAGSEVLGAFNAALEAAGISFEGRGNGVSGGSGLTKSSFRVQPVGSRDLRESFTFAAADRAGFEKQLAKIIPGGLAALEGYEVVVRGLAALDDDLQAPPFVSE